MKGRVKGGGTKTKSTVLSHTHTYIWEKGVNLHIPVTIKVCRNNQ